jgi:adenylate cyclase
MSPLARPASAWIGALLATAVALGLIAADAWHLAARADSLQVAMLEAFASHVGAPAPGWSALSSLLASSTSRFGELAGLAALGLGLVLVIAWRGLILGLVFVIVAVAGTLVLTLWLFLGPHLPVGTLAGSLALLLAYGAAALWQGVALVRWRRRLVSVFAGMLSRQQLRQLLHAKIGDRLTPHSAETSCLALRISAPDPEPDADPTAHFIAHQEVLAQLTEIAKDHGGLLSAVGAHGFTAVWNVPLSEPRHGALACAAALAMVQANQRAQKPTGVKGGAQYALAIGVATGSLSAGVLSFGRWPRYRVAGSCAERAEELRDRAEQFGTGILVCSQTRSLGAGDYAFLEIERDANPVAEAETATGLYALWGPLAAASSPKFRALAVFHDRLFQALQRGQWASARELIAKARKLSGASQRLYDYYADRLARLEQPSSAKAPDVALSEALTSFTRQQPMPPLP